MKKNIFLLALMLALTSCGASTSEQPITDPTTDPTSNSTPITTSDPSVVEPTIPSISEPTTSIDDPTTISSNTSVDTHKHTFGDEYIYDETHHWYPATCGHKEAEEKIKHNFEITVYEPTFEEEGYTLNSCTDCDYSFIDNKKDKLEHNYSKTLSYDEHNHWYQCTDEGYEHLKKDEKPHDFDKKVTNPTFESGGYTTYSCKYCEYSYISDKTNKLEHNYSTTLSYDEHSHWYQCTDKGYEHLKKDEKPHTYNEKVTQPTYESGGYTTYSCKYCEYSYKGNFTNALEHNYSSKLSYDEHNHWYQCIDKGYEHLKKDEKPHDFKITVKAPTYLEKGYTTHQCKVCEYSYIDNYTDLLRHTIKYNLDGGVNSPSNPTSFTVEDEFILQPATKGNLAFVGWFDNDGNPVTIIEKGTNKDLELTARWADIFTISGTKLVKVDGSTPVFNIVIPNGITTIGANAFSECEYVAVVTIPSTVTRMETGAFDGCSYLSTVCYNGTLDQWSQITFDYVTASPMYTASEFYILNSNFQYELVTTIEISDNVTEIKSYAFSGFACVTSVTISKNVAKLNYFSFMGCTSLNEFNIKTGSVLKTVGESAFYGCTSLEAIALPNGLESIEKDAFNGCESLATVTLPKTLKSIGSGAFYSNKALTSIEIPYGITAIEDYTFTNCISLSNVLIPNSVKTIGNFAFRENFALGKINIPNSVTSIGTYAFSSCDGLKSVTIPSSVTSVGIDAFDESGSAIIYCQASSQPKGWDTTWNPSFCMVYWGISASNIYEKNGVEYIAYKGTGYASSFLDTTENVVIENSVNINGTNYTVTTIGESAFSSRENLKTVKLTSNITTIKNHAFSGTDIKYIVIPNSVKTIERNAFYLCFYLTIYCEAGSAQSGWDSEWNSWDCDVYFNGEWTYDGNGVPTPIK